MALDNSITKISKSFWIIFFVFFSNGQKAVLDEELHGLSQIDIEQSFIRHFMLSIMYAIHVAACKYIWVLTFAHLTCTLID